jgi:MurNAc alpha-1-phosphate uridylyltransferase
MKAMILAAGRGERMRPLTDSTPKPLLDVGGKRLIDYHIEALVRAGVRELVVNVSWRGEQVIEALGDGSRWGVKLRISDEGPVALETAGGIFKALPLLGPGPFIVVNGDVWTDFAYPDLSLEAGAMGHLVLVPNPQFHPHGDFGLANGHVVLEAQRRYTFSGIAVYRPEFFAGCQPGRFPLLPLFRRAIEAGALTGQVYRGQWSDIGSPERLEQLRATL